jgi:ABC-2 type transport system permease protein
MSAPLVTLTRVESSLLLREPAAVLFTLGLPLLLLSLNGSQGNAPDPELGGAGAVDVLVAGYLVYVMATSSIMTLAETLADYRDRGILRRMRVSPLRPWQVLGSHALTHLAMSLVGSALLVGLGLAAFDLRAPADLPATMLAVLASALAVLSVGFLLGAVLPTVRTTQAVAAAVYFPSIFISGALFPREMLPELAQRLSDVLPLTYAVAAIRQAWSGGSLDVSALAVLALTTVVATTAGVRWFRWDSR